MLQLNLESLNQFLSQIKIYSLICNSSNEIIFIDDYLLSRLDINLINKIITEVNIPIFYYNDFIIKKDMSKENGHFYFIENAIPGYTSAFSNISNWYQNILDSLPDGVVIVDKNGIITYANQASLRFNEIKKENFVGKIVSDLENQNYFTPVASLMALKSGKIESVIQNLRNKKKLMVFAYPIYDCDGKITHVMVLSSDVTEHLHLNQQLEEKENIIQFYSENLFNISANNSNLLPKFCSKQMEKVQTLINKIATSDINILLTGESGVGKTFWAKEIHDMSSRANKPFVVINCSTIPESLLESELFGYEGGTFTGALQGGKIGLFESAKGGTIFLDEIGELPLISQIKMLQVLQDREIRRIGSDKSIPVDFRLITATNQNLEKLVETKEFREDLYYRLNGFKINIPSLKERPDDISCLIFYFLNKYNNRNLTKKKISQNILAAFKQYPWPGNIRELKHVIESACIISEYDMITFDDLPDNFKYLNTIYEISMPLNKGIPSLKKAMEIVEEDLIKKAYQKYKNSYQVAEVLEISQPSAWRKINKYCNITQLSHQGK